MVSYMFSVIRGYVLVCAAGLNQVIQLVEQLFGGAVDLGVGLAHVLVQGLMRVDRTFKIRDVGTGGVRT